MAHPKVRGSGASPRVVAPPCLIVSFGGASSREWDAPLQEQDACVRSQAVAPFLSGVLCLFPIDMQQLSPILSPA